MPTVYTGPRPIVPHKNITGDIKNPFNGRTTSYSYFPLFLPGHPLDDAPRRNVQPGQGNYPHGYQLSRWYLGLQNTTPMDQKKFVRRERTGYLTNPIYQDLAVPSAKAFPGGYGHVGKVDPSKTSTPQWTNFYFAGVPAGNASLNKGHALRNQNAPGTANNFGRQNPWEYQGLASSQPITNPGHPAWSPSLIADKMPSDYGQIPPARSSVVHYGFEKPALWTGVPSAKAL